MKFSSPLVRGKLLKRYKRFLADIELSDGELITAHCANTGSMKSCGSPGDVIHLSHNPSPKRKLAYSWEYTEVGSGFIGINTMRPNRIVEEAIADKKIPELSSYDTIRREVKYGEASKIDLLLESEDAELPKCYVEIKNVTLKDGDHVSFPDAVTKRGLKHLHELSLMVNEGHRAVLLFFVNRPDTEFMTIAKEVDPAYSKGIDEALASGVEILAYQADSTLQGVGIKGKIPFHH